MKKILALTAVALTAACMGQGPMQTASMEMSPQAESRLVDELRGRVQSGAPLNCVPARTLRGNRSVGEGAIIFRTVGSDLVYVNRPPAGCPEIRPSRAITLSSPSTNICAGDIASVIDPVQRFTFGSCSLGQFTPYRRAR